MSAELQATLSAVGDTLFAKSGTIITPADIPEITEKVDTELEKRGWPDVDRIDIELEDDTEFVVIRVQHGLAKATIELEYRNADGFLWLRVDTDGDGK